MMLANTNNVMEENSLTFINHSKKHKIDEHHKLNRKFLKIFRKPDDLMSICHLLTRMQPEKNVCYLLTVFSPNSFDGK